MLSKTALPHVTAFTMEEKLSSRITISEASLATEEREEEWRGGRGEKRGRIGGRGEKRGRGRGEG